jgi:hypothetical protein
MAKRKAKRNPKVFCSRDIEEGHNPQGRDKERGMSYCEHLFYIGGRKDDRPRCRLPYNGPRGEGLLCGWQDLSGPAEDFSIASDMAEFEKFLKEDISEDVNRREGSILDLKKEGKSWHKVD